MATLLIPSQMSERAGCPTRFECEGHSVGAVFDKAIEAVPALRNKIYATSGRVNRYLRVFVDGNLCVTDVQDVPVKESSQIRIITALAGG